MSETVSTPLCITEVNQWTHCLADNDGKRPAINVQHALKRGLSYEEAKKKSRYNHGFMFNESDEYFGIDVDVDPNSKTKTNEIPQAILDFIEKYPTHVHYSPSGKGIHLIYKVNAKTQKKINKGSGLRNQSVQRGSKFTGELFWHHKFLTFTDNMYTHYPITDISFDELTELLGNFVKSSIKPSLTSAAMDFTATISEHQIKSICAALEHIPPSYGHNLVQSAISKLTDPPMNDYEHWLNIGFALADAYIKAETIGMTGDMIQLQTSFITWSQKGEGYKNDEEVIEKWNNVLTSTRTKSKQNITFKYILALASYCHLVFPVLNSKGFPVNTERSNYKAIFEHLGLHLYEDIVTNEYLVKCKTPGIIDKYFSLTSNDGSTLEWSGHLARTELNELLTGLGQEKGFKRFTNGGDMASFLVSRELKKKDFFRDWVESKPWDGKKRVSDYIKTVKFNTKSIIKEQLYELFLYKNMLCTVGLHIYKGKYRDNTGIVIFQGKENTRKSTWFNNLMPSHWHNSYNFTVNYGAFKGKLAELIRVMVQRKHIIIDECELLVNTSDAELKALISQSSDSIRPMYSDKIVTKDRILTFWGTTNKEKLNLSEYGNRRVWMIPIKFCDTEAQDDFDLQQVYAELLADYENQLALGNTNPWAMSADVIKQVNDSNKQFTNDTEIGLMLKQVYGEYEIGEEPLPKLVWLSAVGPNWKEGKVKPRGNPRLKTLKQVQFDLEIFGRVGLKALKYALQRYCGEFTDSINKTRKPWKTGANRNLLVRKGMIQIFSSKLYMLPEPPEEPDDDLN